jgi:hypothetical protein
LQDLHIIAISHPEQIIGSYASNLQMEQQLFSKIIKVLFAGLAF